MSSGCLMSGLSLTLLSAQIITTHWTWHRLWSNYVSLTQAGTCSSVIGWSCDILWPREAAWGGDGMLARWGYWLNWKSNLLEINDRDHSKLSLRSCYESWQIDVAGLTAASHILCSLQWDSEQVTWCPSPSWGIIYIQISDHVTAKWPHVTHNTTSYNVYHQPSLTRNNPGLAQFISLTGPVVMFAFLV